MNQGICPEIQLEDDLFEVVITGKDLTVSKDEINRILGYNDKKSDRYFNQYIEYLLSGLDSYITIRSGYRLANIRQVADNGNGLYIESTPFTMEKIVTGQLKKAEQAAIFLCTIGPKMENRSRELLQDGDPALGRHSARNRRGEYNRPGALR